MNFDTLGYRTIEQPSKNIIAALAKNLIGVIERGQRFKKSRERNVPTQKSVSRLELHIQALELNERTFQLTVP